MADVSVSLGVTGRDTLLGAFSDVSKAGKAMGEALMEHTKKLAEMYLGWESLVKVMETFRKTMEQGAALSDLAEQTGIATDRLVLLQRAFQNTGLGAEEVGKLVNKMQNFLVSAGDSTSEAAYHVAQLGLNYRDLMAEAPDKQFEQIGRAIASIQDPSERTAAAMGIFGRSGGRLMELFANFPDEMGKAREQVGNFASVMEQNSALYKEIADGLTEIQNKAVEFSAGLLKDTAPAFEQLTRYLANLDATAAGIQYGETFRKGVYTAFSVAIDPGNLFLAYGDALSALLTKIENAFHNGLNYAEDFLGTFLTSLASHVGESMLGALLDAGSKFISFLSTAFDKLAGVLPEKLASGVENASKSLGDLSKRMGLESALNLERSSNAIAKSLGEAADSTHYVDRDFYNVQEDVDRMNSRLAKGQQEINDLLSKGLQTHKEITAEQSKQMSGASASAAGGTISSGKGTGSLLAMGGGAHWSAKPQPILPEETLNTGIFKNTANLSLDQQQDLAAASMRIQGQTPEWYKRYAEQDQKSGNYTGAAYWQRKAADFQQAEGQKALQQVALRDEIERQTGDRNMSRSDAESSIAKKYRDAGYGAAESRSMASAWLDQQAGITPEGAKGGLSNAINKAPGPNPSKGGSSSGGKEPAKADPVTGIEGVVKEILSYMKSSLPQHALT